MTANSHVTSFTMAAVMQKTCALACKFAKCRPTLTILSPFRLTRKFVIIKRIKPEFTLYYAVTYLALTLAGLLLMFGKKNSRSFPGVFHSSSRSIAEIFASLMRVFFRQLDATFNAIYYICFSSLIYYRTVLQLRS